MIISFHSLGWVSGTIHENQSDPQKLTVREGRHSFFVKRCKLVLVGHAPIVSNLKHSAKYIVHYKFKLKYYLIFRLFFKEIFFLKNKYLN